MPPSPTLPPPQRLSVVIPARDEQDALPHTIRSLHRVLSEVGIDHEIVVVNDGSQDDTASVLDSLKAEIPQLRPVTNPGPHGFGRAITYGFGHVQGDAVVIMMADESDDAHDVVRYWQLLCEGYECVFGSRFIKGGQVVDYPKVKLVLNRIINKFISLIFNLRLNDTTNAFKAYRTHVLEGCKPYLAPHFNLTVELPLKSIVRGYTWTVMPISWRNRRFGTAKLKLREMGSRYLFIILYCWLEKYFSRGDYRRKLDDQW
jgi:dolichol-phosphate mannosyltransferase